jgi:tryptophanyl-tRNA synthetase
MVPTIPVQAFPHVRPGTNLEPDSAPSYHQPQYGQSRLPTPLVVEFMTSGNDGRNKSRENGDRCGTVPIASPRQCVREPHGSRRPAASVTASRAGRAASRRSSAGRPWTTQPPLHATIRGMGRSEYIHFVSATTVGILYHPFGELSRMTQFKDKSEHAPQNMNVGLFDYPVLMAADIILYVAAFVPVGDDQLQHLEFTRTLARKFNNKYGDIFIEPQPIITSASRVMSLDQPEKKMSKSRPAGCLFLDDSPQTIRKMIMSAVTDAGREIKVDPEKKPAISNLIDLYGAVAGTSVRDIEQSFEGAGYAEFKKSLAEKMIAFLAPFQKRKAELRAEADLKEILAAGNAIAGEAATKKLDAVKKMIGLSF